MSVDLNICEAVPIPPPHKEVFEIRAEYMHGDMNAFSTETKIFAPEDDLLFLYVRGCFAMMQFQAAHPQGLYSFTQLQLHEAVEQHFKDWSDAITEDDSLSFLAQFLEDFAIQDSTDDSYEYAAWVASIDVFWYDENSVKHRVEIVVDGNTF